MLSEKDLKQIAQKGITQKQIENQLNEFKTGFPSATYLFIQYNGKNKERDRL